MDEWEFRERAPRQETESFGYNYSPIDMDAYKDVEERENHDKTRSD
jgi:hypothetical protein